MKSSFCFLHQWTGVVLTTTGPGHEQQTGQEPGVMGHQQHHQQSPQQQEMPAAVKEDDTQSEGFFSMLKNLLDRARKGRGRTDMSTIDALKVQIHHVRDQISKN